MCIVLGDGQRLPVPIECSGSLVEPSEIAIGQSPIEPLRLFPRALDEVLADGRTEGAAPAVQHQPHAVGLVEAELDEVVPSAERPEPEAPRLVELLPSPPDFRRPLEDSTDAPFQCPHAGPCASLQLGVPCEPDRHPGFDGVAHRAQVVGQLARVEIQSHRVHAAPDVDADRGRNDRRARGDHAPDGGAAAVVHVRHRRDVGVGDGESRHVLQLVECLALGGVGPQLDRHAVRRRLERHLNGHGAHPPRK